MRETQREIEREIEIVRERDRERGGDIERRGREYAQGQCMHFAQAKTLFVGRASYSSLNGTKLIVTIKTVYNEGSWKA